MDAGQIQKKINDDVQRVGWSVISVFADQPTLTPGFAYTVGLYKTLRFPEVVILGLPPDAAQPILNTLGKRVREGRRTPMGERLANLAEGHEMVLQEIAPDAIDRHLVQACNWYKGHHFSAAQLIWPDPANRMPWEPDFDQRYRFAQPLLYAPDANA